LKDWGLPVTVPWLIEKAAAIKKKFRVMRLADAGVTADMPPTSESSGVFPLSDMVAALRRTLKPPVKNVFVMMMDAQSNLRRRRCRMAAG
jgi:hypothetical protein